MSPLRILGLALVLLGVAAAAHPGWLEALTPGLGPASDTYEAIERRVRGGMVLGLGLILLGVPALRPWSLSIPLAIFYFMAGALAARVLGLMVDGVVPKQWLMVAIEAGVMTVAALWLWRGGGVGP